MKISRVRRNLMDGAGLLLGAILLTATAAPRAPRTSSTVAPQIAQGAALLPGPQALEAKELLLAVDAPHSSLHWTLDTTLHTVHGTFRLKRGSLHLDTASGKAAGEIVADAASGESGNESRDKKMHNEILESPRFTELIFRPDRIDGKVPAQGPSSLQIHGVFILHGTEHELTVPVTAEIAEDHWKGTSKFSVPYIQWGLKNPSTFLLKTNPSVGIELQLAGTVQVPASK